MSDGSHIESCDASWNPIRARNPETGKFGHHCEILTPGCEHCYADKMNFRLGTGIGYGRAHRSKIETFLDDKTLTQPLRWRKPRRIFVCSMTDLFGEWVTDEMLDQIFAVMALCPQHKFLVLTKRAERMRDYSASAPDRVWHQIGETPDEWRVPRVDGDPMLPALAAHGATWGGERPWPLRNVWAGVSVEDQRRADERIPPLLATPAAVRWVSGEPLLGQIDLSCGLLSVRGREGQRVALPMFDSEDGRAPRRGYLGKAIGLDWVVCGGESGPGARPMHPAWARSLRDQCIAATVPFFFKQWGEWAPIEEWTGHLGNGRFRTEIAIDASGAEVSDDVNPDDVGGQRFARIGKHAAGRLLDGREWNEFPPAHGAAS